jgi:SAM-dependent methyltransferase
LPEKIILDACCGGRMFWENKEHQSAIYQDIRIDELPLMEKYGLSFTVKPMVVGDFRKMPYRDGVFKMVLFDPPHLCLNKTAWMAKKYGTIKGMDVESDLNRGFLECWRVLRDFGVLIFKWNDQSVDISVVKKTFPAVPIIYKKIGTKGKRTYWYVFMKIPNE